MMIFGEILITDIQSSSVLVIVQIIPIKKELRIGMVLKNNIGEGIKTSYGKNGKRLT